jgi:type I restriction enzyme M protein
VRQCYRPRRVAAKRTELAPLRTLCAVAAAGTDGRLPTSAADERQCNAATMAINSATPLTAKTLGDHLWRSEDKTRNKIQNPKDYVLALLFFKRVSDRYAEETATAFADLEGVPNAQDIIDANPDAFHALQLPAGTFWEDIRNTDEDGIGKALNDALIAMSLANPEQLLGIFETIDFNNKRSVPPDALSDLIDHFEELGPLTDARCPADLLGQAYEWAIARFAASSGKRGGEFYTPGQVGKLGARLLAPQPGETGYDPTCGSGGLLLQLLDEGRRLHGGQVRTISLFGQELTPETWAIARMNMFLHGAGGQATIVQGDTLASPAFLDGPSLRRFDVCIANPPFSSKNWGHERLKAGGDPFGRIKHLPTKTRGEMAFVQHMVASMSERGRLAVVLPNGCFFRDGAEQSIRKDLLDSDLIEAVIQLPADIFYGASIPACWLVLNRAKAAPRADRVLFIDASDGFERVDTKNVLSEQNVNDIVGAFQADDASPGFSVWASREAIAARAFNLTARRYVRPADHVGADDCDLESALSGWRDAVNRRRVADTALDALLSSLEPH